MSESIWLGNEQIVQAQRAAGRGLIAIGEHMSVIAKGHADVVTGTMRRSIHTAPAQYDGAGDEDQAKQADIPGTTRPTQQGTTQIIEVGSWVPYACVEEVVRGHQFMTPAFQEMQGSASDAIMAQAFMEEGMKLRPL